MKGSLPLILSMCHGLGLESSSLTEPCESPITASPNNFCPRLLNCKTSLTLLVRSSVSISDVMATTSNMEDGYENVAQLEWCCWWDGAGWWCGGNSGCWGSAGGTGTLGNMRGTEGGARDVGGVGFNSLWGTTWGKEKKRIDSDWPRDDYRGNIRRWVK